MQSLSTNPQLSLIWTHNSFHYLRSTTDSADKQFLAINYAIICLSRDMNKVGNLPLLDVACNHLYQVKTSEHRAQFEGLLNQQG